MAANLTNVFSPLIVKKAGGVSAGALGLWLFSLLNEHFFAQARVIEIKRMFVEGERPRVFPNLDQHVRDNVAAHAGETMDETPRLIVMRVRQRMRSQVGRDWSSLGHKKVSTCRQMLGATSCFAVVHLRASVRQPSCRRAELGVGTRSTWPETSRVWHHTTVSKSAMAAGIGSRHGHRFRVPALKCKCSLVGRDAQLARSPIWKGLRGRGDGDASPRTNNNRTMTTLATSYCSGFTTYVKKTSRRSKRLERCVRQGPR